MNVIIGGAGEVGRHAAEVLVAGGHSVTMIDVSARALHNFEELVDVRTLRGSICHAEELSETGIDKCDLFIATTDQDEINLLGGAIAKRMGATRVIARIHHRAYVSRVTLDYAKYLDIDHLICPEHLTALVIARSLRNPGATAIERFAQDKIEMQQYTVTEKSASTDVPLSRLPLPTGVRLAVVVRNGSAFIPNAESVLTVGDHITVLGEARHFDEVRKVLHQEKVAVTKVVVMGGTPMAVWLARALHSRHFSVRLFETNANRAEELSHKLAHVTVIQADPTDLSVFQEENIQNSHAFVAVSDSDEHNILGALQAKELGARQTFVVIAQPTYLHLLEHVSIGKPFSPRIVAAKEIVRLIDVSPVRRLATLAENTAEVYELDPVKNGSAVNQPLNRVKLPRGAIVAAIQRGDEVRMPVATDVIRPGDVLIVIGPGKIEKHLRNMFIGK